MPPPSCSERFDMHRLADRRLPAQVQTGCVDTATRASGLVTLCDWSWKSAEQRKEGFVALTMRPQEDQRFL